MNQDERTTLDVSINLAINFFKIKRLLSMKVDYTLKVHT